MVRPALAALVASLLVFQEIPARADSPLNARTAEALFAEGRRLMAAGKVDEACPKFAESQRIDPALGTELNLATCYMRAGKTASAWSTFRDAEAAAAKAGEKTRAALAKKEAALLEPTLSVLTIVVDADAAIPGLAVRCDGAPLAEGAWRTALPMDPGTHVIDATAPGRRPWSARAQVEPGASKLSVAIPVLEPDPAALAVISPAPSLGGTVATRATGSTPVAAPAGEAGASRGRTQRITGLTAGAVGLAAIGVGAYFGVQAGSTYSEALAACGGTRACTTDRGLQLRHDTDAPLMISNVALIAGGALLAGGALVFFTAPKGKTTSNVGIAVSPSKGSGAVFSMRAVW